MKASICYQTVSPESAEQGDIEDHGYYLKGGWKYSLFDSETEKDIKDNSDEYNFSGGLRELIDFSQSLGISFHPGTDWGESIDPDIDYATGESTTYSLHISEVTDSTFNRIKRLL